MLCERENKFHTRIENFGIINKCVARKFSKYLSIYQIYLLFFIIII